MVKHAIDQGYRHIDTALFYQNEVQVGQAIREKVEDGTVKREDIFLVTKLWVTYNDPVNVEKGCRISLRNLGLDYIDLYLMHAPMSLKYNGDTEADLTPKSSEGSFEFIEVDYLETWREMEKLVEKGLVKSIGVSNFNSEQVERILREGKIKPVVNQVECGPTINQKPLTKFCKDRGVEIVAYTPLGRVKPSAPTGPKTALEDNRVIAMGSKYNKTPVQILLRYLIGLGVTPIPKSSNFARVSQNINIFDFELTSEEMDIIGEHDKNERTIDFVTFAKHKYYPFNIPY